MAKASKVTIETVIRTRYGIEPEQADALVIEWAAEHLASIIGVDAAGAEWKRINRKRNKAGRYTSIPAWKSLLWDSYFAKPARKVA